MRYTYQVDWQSKRNTKEAKVRYTKGTYGYTTTQVTERTIQKLSDAVSVEVDVAEIVKQIAYRAAHNESGRATWLHGLVKAKRTNRNVLSTTTEQLPIDKDYVEVAE